MAEPLLVHHGKLHYYVREVFKRLRVPPKDASKVADVLVAAELYGIESEGMARLRFFADRLSAGLINKSPRIEAVRESPSGATVDGDNGLGPVVASKAMELALIKAARTGVGAVAVKRSNPPGALSYYARLALPKEMLGVALANAPPTLAPRNDAPALVGANSIAVAAPALSGRPFVLNMAASDARSFDAAVAADVLCGVLGGGAFGLELSAADKSGASLGQFFAAIHVKAFSPYSTFLKRTEEMLKTLTDPPGPRLEGLSFPGLRESETEQERRTNGIPLAPDVAKELARLARGLALKEAWEQVRSSRDLRE